MLHLHSVDDEKPDERPNDKLPQNGNGMYEKQAKT